VGIGGGRGPVVLVRLDGAGLDGVQDGLDRPGNAENQRDAGLLDPCLIKSGNAATDNGLDTQAADAIPPAVGRPVTDVKNRPGSGFVVEHREQAGGIKAGAG
jgi:hypothetical protein